MTVARKRTLSARTGLALLALGAGLGLSACSSSMIEDVQDAVQTINPLGEKEKVLKGERKPVLDGQEVGSGQPARTVAVPPARSVAAWTQAGGGPGNNPGNVALDTASGARAWTTRAASEASGGSWGSKPIRVFAKPVVAGGAVFAYGPDGVVSAHSVSGGGRIWSTNLRPEGSSDAALGGGVASDGQRVYVATGYGPIVALDAGSGRELWRGKIGEPARGAPAVGDGKVIVVSQGNTVYALNQADGTEAWTFRGIPEMAGLMSGASPAVTGGQVIVPFTSGEIVALDVKTGTPMWNDALSRSGPTLALSGLSDISASPVVDEGIVFTTGVGGKTVAFRQKSGERLWEAPYGSAHTPVVAGSVVYLVDLDDRLIAMDKKSGQVAWSTRLPVTRTKKVRTAWAGPTLASGQLWLVSSEGAMVAVDAASGRVTQTREDAQSPAYLGPVAASGKLFVLSGDGTLAAYQ